jgi:ribonuclease Y
MEFIFILGGALVGLIGGGASVVAYRRLQDERKLKNASVEAEKILHRAKSEASRIDRDSRQKAKDFEIRARKNAESDIQKQKQKLAAQEQNYRDKEKKLEQEQQLALQRAESKLAAAAGVEEKVRIAEKRLQEQQDELENRKLELVQQLQKASSMTADQAKEQLVAAMEDQARHEAGRRAIVIEEEAKAQAEKKAKRIISLAISRYSGEYAAERTVSVVALPSDELKGKIIGREGRNIRALEAACGVDLIVDDTPEAVVISAFDPVRREVARRALERLMEDGRVHPARIEEVIAKVKSELFKSIKEDGDKALFELGILNVNPEIVKLVGSLKYRTSYTQNNYTHSIEVGFLAGMMASELGADVKAARRAGLLHDIGKALDHSVEGSHAVIGAEFAKRHGEREPICHAIRSHHEDEKPNSVIAHLVQAADALSSARPGARRSMMESYIRRLEDLESIGNSFDGVIRTFALQAGREVRVIVEASKVTDEQSIMLSRDVARKIERELNYPGQIKVTVVRETRAIEHAR